jgi:hypothetical protein
MCPFLSPCGTTVVAILSPADFEPVDKHIHTLLTFHELVSDADAHVVFTKEVLTSKLIPLLFKMMRTWCLFSST